MRGELFDGYEHEGFFDEAFEADGSVRAHYMALIKRLSELTPDQLVVRARLRDEAFRTAGITFTVYGEGATASERADQTDGIERTFPMDLLPRLIPGDEWQHIERGLVQRVAALNLFLDDLYVGERAAIHDGIVPKWLVSSSSGFKREGFGLPVPKGARCLVAGIDLVRDANGAYCVLEDNLRNPSGISYVLENRASMTRVLPAAFQDHGVRPVHHYGNLLLDALRHVAPPTAGEDPTVVVLTPGVFNSAYFEHAFLARQMGVELVEGRDLIVEDHVVSMRTTRGLERVDVIYRRVDDDFLDPVVFRPDSTLGVPGLMAAARAGNVTLANAVGNGVADDKAVYAYVPELIRYYLGEDPILPNVDTYLLWDEDHRAAVLDRIDQLVVKPVAESGGYGMLMPGASDSEVAAHARSHLRRAPRVHRGRGRVPVAPSHARRRSHRRPSRGLAPVRVVGRERRGDPRGTDPCRLAARFAGRELQPGRRFEGHVGARPGHGRRLMLARHAENLFWTGRYIERAEDTARILDVTYHGLLEAAPTEAARAWADVLAVLRLTADFDSLGSGYDAVSVSQFLVSDIDNPGSIVSSVARHATTCDPYASSSPPSCGRASTASTWTCGRAICGPTSRPSPTSCTRSSSSAASSWPAPRRRRCHETTAGDFYRSDGCSNGPR